MLYVEILVICFSLMNEIDILYDIEKGEFEETGKQNCQIKINIISN